jgi:peptidoglycan hydrolase-like protein with peptidoglycan-binding domain
VRAAQLLLIGRGFRCGPWGADGEFGAATYGALFQFQRAKKLSADGVLGPESWAALLGV